jgi:hypothetical protein
MAAVPLLGLAPLGQAPAGSLPSEAEVIQLLWGHVPDFKGFRGVGSVCCSVVWRAETRERRAICLDVAVGGCGGQESPCLLFKVKERWEEAGIPTFDNDCNIITKISSLKAALEKKRKNKLTEEQKQQYIDKLMTTTFNLAPSDWERRIRRETFRMNFTNVERIRIVLDYIGPEATRSVPIPAESTGMRNLRRSLQAGRGQAGGEADEQNNSVDPEDVVQTEGRRQEAGRGERQRQEAEGRRREAAGADSESTGREEESQESGEEQVYAERLKRSKQRAKKRRREDGEDPDDEDEFVWAKVPEDEREEAGRKLLALSQIPGTWVPGSMEIKTVEPLDIIHSDQVGNCW